MLFGSFILENPWENSLENPNQRSWGTFPILSRDPSFQEAIKDPGGNSRCLKRTMVEKNQPLEKSREQTLSCWSKALALAWRWCFTPRKCNPPEGSAKELPYWVHPVQAIRSLGLQNQGLGWGGRREGAQVRPSEGLVLGELDWPS